MSRLRALAARLRRWAFWPMVRKEFIQMRRDRVTLALITGLPAIQLVLFGYAVRTEVRHQRMVVVDHSRTSESRALVRALVNTGNFDVVGALPGAAEASRWLDDGRARAALVIPPDYMARIKRGETARAQLLVDAADPTAASGALGAAQLAAAARGAELVRVPPAARVPRVELRVRPKYNPAQRSAVFIVPGVIGILLTLTMTVVTSSAVVRERERGTLEQLVVTPIDRTSLMLGKTVPFVLVGYVQMTVVLVLGELLFDVPMRGFLPTLYLLAFPFIFASLGVGLLVSTVATTQAQAMQMSFFFALPNILLSGYMFPLEAMPAAARAIGLALPLTHFLRVLRGVLLKGATLPMLTAEGALLVAFAVVLFAVAVRRFRKTIE